MISAMRLDGSTADTAIEASTGRRVFHACLKDILVPTLKKGDLVVMDNLSAHKRRENVGIIEKAGAQAVFLPPCSPDPDPIEMMWSKARAFLRKTEARTRETLFEAIGKALRSVTPQDAMGWFAHCGYNII